MGARPRSGAGDCRGMAPEHLVRGLVERLQSEFGGETETRTLIEEDVSFELPRSLRTLAVVSA